MASILNVDQINNAAGTNALTIDSSGRILTPARPAFSVSRVDTGATGTSGHIQFNTVDTNINSCWDTTNYRFEAPIAGVYHFSFTGMSAGTASGGQLPANVTCNVQMEKSVDSGSNWSHLCNSYNYKPSTSGFHNQAVSGTFTLNNGDYVRINVTAYYIYSNTAPISLNPTFSGFLVG